MPGELWVIYTDIVDQQYEDNYFIIQNKIKLLEMLTTFKEFSWISMKYR